MLKNFLEFPKFIEILILKKFQKFRKNWKKLVKKRKFEKKKKSEICIRQKVKKS